MTPLDTFNNTLDFHKSTARELLATKDRVRYLINHWGEEGRYKEAVIKSVIQRFLPERLRVGSGFVVKPGGSPGQHQCSKQIDLIIYDTAYPVLFKEGDFAILTPDSVSGIIEVKANVLNQQLRHVVDSANRNGRFIFEAKKDKTKPFFNGIFSYESEITETIVEGIHNKIQTTNLITTDPTALSYCVNHISFNTDWFYKFWPNKHLVGNPANCLYRITELSFSFFISNLIDFVGNNNSILDNSNIWFPYDKELQLQRSF